MLRNLTHMKFKSQLCMAAWLSCVSASLAQIPGGSAAGFNASLTRLFGDVTAFSAKAEARVLDEQDKEVMVAPMDFALLDRKIRIDIDLTQAKSRDFSPEMIAMMKQQGLANMVSIVRPDKNLVYLIYPAQKSSLSMPLPEDQAENLQGKTKLQKLADGKETIDGHDCVRNKVIVTDVKGHTMEATTWNASDLRDFPIQIRTKEKGNTSLMRFRDIKFASPDSKQFELPEGYAQYKEMQEMMQAILTKGLGASGNK